MCFLYVGSAWWKLTIWWSHNNCPESWVTWQHLGCLGLFIIHWQPKAGSGMIKLGMTEHRQGYWCVNDAQVTEAGKGFDKLTFKYFCFTETLFHAKSPKLSILVSSTDSGFSHGMKSSVSWSDTCKARSATSVVFTTGMAWPQGGWHQ